MGVEQIRANLGAFRGDLSLFGDGTPSAHFDHSVRLFKERKVAPKRAQIRPDLLHPHGYPPRASKRHIARSWGHTRELADILSVRYIGESVPGKYPLT